LKLLIITYNTAECAAVTTTGLKTTNSDDKICAKIDDDREGYDDDSEGYDDDSEGYDDDSEGYEYGSSEGYDYGNESDILTSFASDSVKGMGGLMNLLQESGLMLSLNLMSEKKKKPFLFWTTTVFTSWGLS
jgi:hypothetical protein